jgi:hypothetical protein
MEAPELLITKPPPAPPESLSTQLSNCVQTINSVSLTPAKAPINKQIETRTSDGKRRITPMFIPPPPDIMLDTKQIKYKCKTLNMLILNFWTIHIFFSTL